MENNNLPAVKQDNAMAFSPDTARVVQEVQGAIIVAQHCPRNEQKAFTEIINACKRNSLAEQSMYSFPRGNKTVSGPSIRLAEVIARHWGNLQYGIREITNDKDETKYEAYCWDVQTNTRASRIFTQKHGRWTKAGGFKKVVDPRDIYEVVASSATRRLRACILEIIPGDIVDDAVVQCKKTLTGNSTVPIKDRVRKMVQKFSELGVSEEMLEQKVNHKLEVLEEIELVNLVSIFKSISDGMSSRSDWFSVEQGKTSDLNNRFDNKEVEPKEEPEQEPKTEVTDKDAKAIEELKEAAPAIMDSKVELPKTKKAATKKVDPKAKLKDLAKKKPKNFAPGS